jgi:hypothetical protein
MLRTGLCHDRMLRLSADTQRHRRDRYAQGLLPFLRPERHCGICGSLDRRLGHEHQSEASEGACASDHPVRRVRPAPAYQERRVDLPCLQQAGHTAEEKGAMSDRQEITEKLLAITDRLVDDLVVASKSDMEPQYWRDGAEAVRSLIEARGMLLLELKDG